MHLAETVTNVTPTISDFQEIRNCAKSPLRSLTSVSSCVTVRDVPRSHIAGTTRPDSRFGTVAITREAGTRRDPHSTFSGKQAACNNTSQLP